MKAKEKPQAEPKKFRVCERCARDDGAIGPRPPGSMLKLVGNELRYACSVPCGRALGWRSI